MSDPAKYFESVLRLPEESPLPTPDVDVDHLLSLSSDDRDAFTKALADYYGDTHWASDESNFKSAIEAAFQVVAAGVSRLQYPQEYRPNDLDCCVRVVHSPSLAAYVKSPLIKSQDATPNPHTYIVVPAGFISSVQSYVSTIYALASVGAATKDPSRRSVLWNSEMILGALTAVWDKDEGAFLEGVCEYSAQLCTASILGPFDDSLALTPSNPDLLTEMRAMMREMMRSQRLRKLGFTNTEDTLAEFQEVGQISSVVSKLLLAYTISHEVGHLFMSTVPHSDASALASDESAADLFGIQILWRLYETGLFQRIGIEEATPFNLVSAVMAFHSWNLSQSLAEVLAKMLSTAGQNLQPSLDKVHEIAKRCYEIRTMLHNALSADAEGPPSETAIMLTDSWMIPCAGLLLLNFRACGLSGDLYESGDLLPHLADRQSKVYEYLSKPRTG